MRSIAIGALALCSLSCGSGVGALVAALSDDSEGANDRTEVASVLVDPDAANTKASPLAFSFDLIDAESEPAGVEVLVVPPGGGPELAAQLSPGETTAGLATSPTGTTHAFHWEFAAQLASGSSFAPGYRLRVRVAGGGSEATSPTVDVGNDAPEVGGAAAPPGPIAGTVAVDVDLVDSSSDLVSVAVEYENLDAPHGFQPATSLGAPFISLATTPAGAPATFFWDVLADEPGLEFDARLRFTPDDGFAAGAPLEIDVGVDNNAAPIAQIDGAAFFATPDRRRGIPVPFDVIDSEGDAVDVVFQWKTPLESFPALPADPAGIEAILADPALRELHRIATERPARFGGRFVEASPTALRLDGLHGPRSALVAGGLAGREVEILRAAADPIRLDPTWSTNPLSAPVAVLPALDPTRALVLDAPAAGEWRLTEVEVATGAQVGVVATEVGANGTAAEWLRAPGLGDAGAVVVAEEQAGVWSLVAVEVGDGSETTLATASGSTELGSVGGVAPLGPDSAVITVGSTLAHLDWSDPANVVEESLLADLQGPRDVVRDPLSAGRVLVAEHDWIDPATSQPEGRVVAVDLFSLQRTQVGASGSPLAHPSSLALGRGGARLFALTDGDPLDGTTELRAVDLVGADAGTGFELASGFPDDAVGLAAGPNELATFVAPGSDALFVSGGVEQRRAIAAFDAGAGTATLDAALDPTPSFGSRWRIEDRLAALDTSGGSARRVFVWDSGDLEHGGMVSLRATPYDSETGVASSTGAPREVLASLDVEATAIGGPGSTDGVASVALADLNGDGAVDVASANPPADSVALFFQSASGAFPVAPDASLAGFPLLTPTDEPVAVAALDADGDGDTDLVTANRGSDDATVFVQGGAGSFSPAVGSFGGAGDDPADLAPADFDGDGRTDFAIANAGTGTVDVHLQAGLGLFSGFASETMGDAGTLQPTSVAAGDFDRDGAIDLAVALTGADRIAIFTNGGGGSFAASPSVLLGGTGITDAPVGVAVGDLDVDGSLDLASANAGGDDVTTFVQDALVGWPSAPTDVLIGASGPIDPAHVALGDLDGDGRLDVVATSAGMDLHVFTSDDASGGLDPKPLVLDGGGGLPDPRWCVPSDLNGDALVDLVVACPGASEIVLLVQRGAGSFEGPAPDLRLGGPASIAVPLRQRAADLDADGDLDLVVASSGGDGLAIFPQLGPAVFSAVPSSVLGSAAATPDPRALATGDVDGDARIDVVSANAGTGDLAVFLQRADGTFSSTPDDAVGAGAIGTPEALELGDLDADGDPDLACASPSTDAIALFLRASDGSYPAAPDQVLADPVGTDGPVALRIADVDGDGALDLASANGDGGDFALLLQTAANDFPSSPDATLGSPASTPAPADLAIADVDMDGALDLVGAVAGNDTLALFLQTAAGAFPPAPDLAIGHSSMLGPRSVAVADMDLDGDRDLVSANAASSNVTIFAQTQPGAFAPEPTVVGGAGATDDPRSLQVVDLDGDGDPDLALADAFSETLAIYFASH